MRISDWSSDVCSSDLEALNPAMSEQEVAEAALDRLLDLPGVSGGFIHAINAQHDGFHILAALNSDLDRGKAACDACSCVNRFSQDELLVPEFIPHFALLSRTDVVGHVSITRSAEHTSEHQ